MTLLTLVVLAAPGVFSEAPRAARLLEEADAPRVLVAQSEPPLLESPSRAALEEERDRLREEMPSLALPIVLIVAGGILTAVAGWVYLGPVFAIVGLIAGGVLTAVGIGVLIGNIVRRARATRRIHAIERDLRYLTEERRTAPPLVAAQGTVPLLELAF